MGESGEAGGGGTGGGASQAPVSLADMMPKVDISGQIKSSLIGELGDKNWKVRGEALQQVCTYRYTCMSAIILNVVCVCVCVCVCVHVCAHVCTSERSEREKQ